MLSTCSAELSAFRDTRRGTLPCRQRCCCWWTDSRGPFAGPRTAAYPWRPCKVTPAHRDPCEHSPPRPPPQSHSLRKPLGVRCLARGHVHVDRSPGGVIWRGADRPPPSIRKCKCHRFSSRQLFSQLLFFAVTFSRLVCRRN